MHFFISTADIKINWDLLMSNIKCGENRNYALQFFLYSYHLSRKPLDRWVISKGFSLRDGNTNKNAS